MANYPPLSVRHRSWRSHLVVLAVLAVLSLALTWPLVLHLGTHVPGDGIDDPALAWNLWWVKAAVVDRQIDPYQMNWMFYPPGINLAFYTLTVFNAFLGLPLQLATSVILANNLLLLASLVISGYGTFLLVLEVLRFDARAVPARRYWPALVGALVFAFASSRMFYIALGQVNIASAQWIPFCALYLVRLGRTRTRPTAIRNGALAGLFLAMQLWTEMTFASFLLVLVGLFAAWWVGREVLARRRSRRRPAQLEPTAAPGWLWRVAMPGLVTMAVVVVIAALPLLASMLPDLQAEGDFFSSGGGFAAEFSADVRGFVQPNQLHPLLGQLAAALPFAHDKGQHLFWGFTVTGLALWGLWAGRRRPDIVFWGVATALFLWLTLGPTLRVNGVDTGIPGPFAILQELPFFKGNRYPSRYSVMVLLGLAVLTAAGVDALFARWATRQPANWRPAMSFAAVGLAGLIIFEHLAVPLPLTDLTVPAIYRRVADETGDFTLLEIPLGLRNGARVLGKKDVLIMFEQWYQTVHGKRLVGGNTSRNPPFKFQYFSQAPVLSTLIGLTNAADEPLHTTLRQLLADPAAWQTLLDHDRPLVGSFLRQFDVRYVAVHNQAVPDTVRTYLETLFPLSLIATQDGISLYRVEPQAAAAAPVDLTAPDGTLYLGEGWSGWVQPPLLGPVWSGSVPAAAWAERERVRLLYPLSARGGELTLQLRAPGPDQRVRIEINGWQSVPHPVDEDWQRVTIAVPPGIAQTGMNDIDLVFDRLYPVETALNSAAESAQPPVAVLVESAGEETGDFGHIWVNGIDEAPRPGEPGYQVVVIDPTEGRVTTRAYFDTLADPAASDALVRFIAAVPAGHWVAVAAADDASLALQPAAVDALRTIGAVGDLRGRFRWGHAILGTKGAAPGTALESMGALQPAAVYQGGPWHSTEVAAALRTFSWKPAE